MLHSSQTCLTLKLEVTSVMYLQFKLLPPSDPSCRMLYIRYALAQDAQMDTERFQAGHKHLRLFKPSPVTFSYIMSESLAVFDQLTCSALANAALQNSLGLSVSNAQARSDDLPLQTGSDVLPPNNQPASTPFPFQVRMTFIAALQYRKPRF